MFALASAALLAGSSLSGQRETKERVGNRVTNADKADACKLLTSGDVEAVQGEAVKETMPSVQPGGDLRMSQCLFRTATFAKSVSVSLTTTDPAEKQELTPRKFLRRQFHPGGVRKEEAPAVGKAQSKSEADREDEERGPRRISSVGDEAYWVGSSIAGALSVLHENVFFRISVGGVPQETTRMEKSKALARAALKRL